MNAFVHGFDPTRGPLRGPHRGPARTLQIGLLAGLICATALVLSACPTPDSIPESAYPGRLVDPVTIAPDFMWRQLITASKAERSDSFQAVLEKRGGGLVMVGLTDFTKAFVLKQIGTEDIQFERFVPIILPFPPRFMLLDLHRTFMMGFGAPTKPDGLHAFVQDAEHVTERWQGGLLIERTFERQDHQPPGVIRIDYGGGWDGGLHPPETVVVYQGWFDYRLTIKTLQSQRLTP